jgi:SAM-dependent methyltransferase
MVEFWETSFRDKQEMWGWEPADSAVETLELFKKIGLNKILIPGIGYGRNAKIFTDSGFEVTGIEISETAIDLAKKQFDDSLKIYHGSVGSMPFDEELYDGIFSYSLIHLLGKNERLKLIADCYNQLKPNGFMVFVSISKLDFRYGRGKEISKDTFEPWAGLTLFFYDSDSVQSEFGNHGLLSAEIMKGPIEDLGDKPSQSFWYIICKKENGIIGFMSQKSYEARRRLPKIKLRKNVLYLRKIPSIFLRF